jgi:ribosomal protein L37AE/L43A
MRRSFQHPCPFCEMVTTIHRINEKHAYCGRCQQTFSFPPLRPAARELWEVVNG